MNIVIIGTSYPYRGGLAAYNERLARQLVSDGHKVSIMTFTLQYPVILFPGKSQFLGGPPPQDLNIERSISSVNPLSWLSAGKSLLKRKPDIIIIKYWLPFMAPCFGTIARLARRNCHSKVICIFDNVIPHEKRPGDRILTKYFITSVDGAIAMSASVLNDIALFRKDIPTGLNPHPLFDNFGEPLQKMEALKRLGLDSRYKWLLFFGFIRAYKGLDLLLKAFSDSRLRSKNLKLIVAGEFYEDETRYRELVKTLNLENDVVFFDRFINDEEVKVFFSSADIVVQPYRSATQSGVTQIAYHFTRPMIVTDVGGLREIVPHERCGYIVDAEPVSIADAIADFYSRGREEEFRKNIVDEKSKYSWNKMTGALMEVYNKIVSNDSKK